MAETLKLPSSTRCSRGADRSNTQWQRDVAVVHSKLVSIFADKAASRTPCVNWAKRETSWPR
jgi:hypothetical protein